LKGLPENVLLTSPQLFWTKDKKGGNIMKKILVGAVL
jgi:hypothetical protein